MAKYAHPDVQANASTAGAMLAGIPDAFSAPARRRIGLSALAFLPRRLGFVALAQAAARLGQPVKRSGEPARLGQSTPKKQNGNRPEGPQP